MIRALDREVLVVPAADGEPVELRIQGFQLRADAGPDGAAFTLPSLFFGNRREIKGLVWRGKSSERLQVERR